MKQHENIKTSSFAKTSEDKQMSKVKIESQNSKIPYFLIGLLIFLMLIINLVGSQLISPIYFQIINDNKKATVTFLQKIKTLPEYQKNLEMNDNIYGNTVQTEIFAQENKKKEMINNLEQQLTINPKARDVLYSLYQLYLADGNNDRANDYLRRAKEVDPSLK